MKVNMKQRLVHTAVLVMFALLAAVWIQPSASQGMPQTIFIQSNGSVSPSTVPIQRNGDTYTFTGDVYATIKILKSNIVLDGAGYKLWGPYAGGESDLLFIGSNCEPYNSTQPYTIGVDLGLNVHGITIRNLNVENFSIGMYMWTRNNTLVGNAVSGNVIGIMLSGANTTIADNCISNNSYGVFYGFNNGIAVPTDMILTGNAFENNSIQLNGCQCSDYSTAEPPHNWDNGQQGNYWGDYNGTDSDGDGIGDTYYVIDVLNQDRYPQMQSLATPPTPKPQLADVPQAPWQLIAVAVTALGIGAVGAVVWFTKRRIATAAR
jgi:parallel beta-helix repeat protein